MSGHTSACGSSPSLRRELEDGSAAGESAAQIAAVTSSAVEVASFVQDQAGNRMRTVWRGVEAVQNGQLAGCAQLEHGSVAEGASIEGGSVEIAD